MSSQWSSTYWWSPIPTFLTSASFYCCQFILTLWPTSQSPQISASRTSLLLEIPNPFKLFPALICTLVSPSGTPSFARLGRWWKLIWKDHAKAHYTVEILRPSRLLANSRLQRKETLNWQKTPGQCTPQAPSTPTRSFQARTLAARHIQSGDAITVSPGCYIQTMDPVNSTDESETIKIRIKTMDWARELMDLIGNRNT